MPDTVDDVGPQRQELLDARYDPAGEPARGEHTLREPSHRLDTPVEYLRLLALIQEAVRAAPEDDQPRDTLIPEPGGEFRHRYIDVLIHRPIGYIDI